MWTPKALCLIGLLSIGGTVSADYVGTQISKVVFLDSYNQYGNGDVVFKVEHPVSACPDGYWLTKSDAGFPANLSMLLAAYQAKNPVRVYGLPDQIWNGSSGKYCKLYSIEFH